jgi:four helix bundle protein
MGMIFEDLDAWKQARILVREVYVLCRDEKLGRDFGLRDQIQRASVSVMTNVAEGFERTGTQEKLHFYNIARASAGEVRSLLYVVEDNFPQIAHQSPTLRNAAIGTGKLISGLIASTQRRTAAKAAAIATLILLPISYLLSSIF